MSVVHTAVVARKIKRGREREYEQWLSSVAKALRSAPEYDGMTVISSPDPQGTVRTILIRFRSVDALSVWEHSTARRHLAEQGNRFSTAYYQTAPGVETFFAIPGSRPGPPRWKMCILTVPAVYLLLSLVLFLLGRLFTGFKDWPVQVRMIPVTCIMTVLLTYVCLPILSRLFAPWLFSSSTSSVTHTFEPINS